MLALVAWGLCLLGLLGLVALRLLILGLVALRLLILDLVALRLLVLDLVVRLPVWGKTYEFPRTTNQCVSLPNF